MGLVRVRSVRSSLGYMRGRCKVLGFTLGFLWFRVCSWWRDIRDSMLCPQADYDISVQVAVSFNFLGGIPQ